MHNYKQKYFWAGTMVVVGFVVGAVIGQYYSAASAASVRITPVDLRLSANTQVVNGIDLTQFYEAWNILNERFVSGSATATPVSDQDKIYGAIAGLAASYRDPYTSYFPPEDNDSFLQDMSGEFSGIGVQIDIIDSVLTIVSPLKDTPAEKAGLIAKDRILKINGTSTDGFTNSEASNLIRGKKGTVVTLTIWRDGKVFDVDVMRDTIVVPIITTSEKDGVFIITFSSFTENSVALFAKALQDFEKSGRNRLLIDVRGNPGGYLEAAVEISSMFLPKDVLIVNEKFGYGENVKKHIDQLSKGHNVVAKNVKVAVLIDGGSASASEILAGALQDHKRATVLGTTSFGKGSVQQLIPLSDGSSLKVTIAHWYTPNGRSISKDGIQPDVEIELNLEKYKADGTDTQLNGALDYLNGRKVNTIKTDK